MATNPLGVVQVMAAREGLPILGMEQEIMELIGQHDTLVLCGETGCGKTTQVRPAPCPAGLHHETGCGHMRLVDLNYAHVPSEPEPLATSSQQVRKLLEQ